jgi:hypothetical protein
MPQLGPGEVHLSSVPEAASVSGVAVPDAAGTAAANGDSSTEAVGSSPKPLLEHMTSWELQSSESDATVGTAAARCELIAARQASVEALDGLLSPQQQPGTSRDIALAEQPQVPRNGFGSHAAAASAAAAAKFASF